MVGTNAPRYIETPPYRWCGASGWGAVNVLEPHGTKIIEVGPSPIELASSDPISYISSSGLTAGPLGIFRVNKSRVKL